MTKPLIPRRRIRLRGLLLALAASAVDLAAAPRISGPLPAPGAPPPSVSYSRTSAPGLPGRVSEIGRGDFSLDFADTDIREVVGQILGGLLHRTYTIDPAVHGTATLHTAQPVSAQQLLPTLQMLLANVGAVLVPADGLFRVIPAASAGASGSVVIPLRYVSADELAKVLQPVAGPNTKITAESGLNALLVAGDPPQIEAVRDLVLRGNQTGPSSGTSLSAAMSAMWSAASTTIRWRISLIFCCRSAPAVRMISPRRCRRRCAASPADRWPGWSGSCR